MPLINCKFYLEMTWIENCVLSSAGDFATFKITNAKLYFPIVTLLTEDNVKLTKQLRNLFKRSVYWNEYIIMPAKVISNETNIYKLLSASSQGIKRLFVPVYDSTADDNAGKRNNKKKVFPRAWIKNYNVLIDGRNFYDQPIIKQSDEVRKVAIGQGDYYTTGCSLDYAYFQDNYKLMVVRLSKQIVFQGVARVKLRPCTIPIL